MGILYLRHFEHSTLRTYKCRNCFTDLAYEKDFFFKDYLGMNKGESLLFKDVENTYNGLAKEN